MPVSLILSLLLAGASPDAPRRLPPVDECASDREFTAFRSELQRAVISRNAGALLELVDEEIEGNSDGFGRDDFVREWRLDRPADSPLWRELDVALGLGCLREDEDMYEAPSLQLQLEDLEDSEFNAVAMQGGALQAAPDAASAVLGTLDWELAAVETVADSVDWLQVRLADGRTGFVRREDVRRTSDYRAGFERNDDRWLLSWFYSGD